MIGRDPYLRLSKVQRTFVADIPVRAVMDATLAVDRGEYLSIVGPSGSGKSTLLHILGLLDTPTSGEYTIGGISTNELMPRERAWLRARKVGFVFQSFYLMSHRSVLDNVTARMLYDGTPRRRRPGVAEAALRRVGLGHRLHFYPSQLSGGEQQRVAIARALVGHPELLCCDEPTGNLDAGATEGVMDFLDELRATSNLTIITVTHDMLVSARADRTCRMIDGVLVESPC